MKSLRLVNFKSFGEASVPTEGQHVAILGPNHAGKSNLLDAVQFVLGYDVSSRGELLTRGVKDAVESSVVAEFQVEDATVTLGRTQVGPNSNYFVNSVQVSCDVYQERVAAVVGSRTPPTIRQNATGFYEGLQLSDYLERHVTPGSVIEEYDLAQASLSELQKEAKALGHKAAQQRKVVSAAEQEEAALSEQRGLEEEYRQCWKDSVVSEIQAQASIYSAASAALSKLQNAKEKASGELQESQARAQQAQEALQQAELGLYQRAQEFQDAKNVLDLDLSHQRAVLLTEKRVAERKLENVVQQRSQLRQNITKQQLERQEIEVQIKAHQRLSEQQKTLPPDYLALQKQFELDNAQLMTLYGETKHLAKRAGEILTLREDQLSQQETKVAQSEEAVATQIKSIEELEMAQNKQQESIADITKETNALKKEISQNQTKIATILDRLPQINRQIEASGELQKEIQTEKRFAEIIKHIARPGVLGYVKDIFSTQSEAAEFIIKPSQYSLVVDSFETIGNLLPTLRQVKCQLQLLPLDKLRFTPEQYARQHSAMQSKANEFSKTLGKGGQPLMQPLIDVVRFSAQYLPVAAHLFGDIYLYNGTDLKEARRFSQQERARVVTADCIHLGTNGSISVQLTGDKDASARKRQDVPKNLPAEKLTLEQSLSDLQNRNNALTAHLQALINTQLPDKSLQARRTEARLQAASSQLKLLKERLQEEKKSLQSARAEYEAAVDAENQAAQRVQQKRDEIRQKREQTLGKILNAYGLTEQEAAALAEHRDEEKKLRELQQRLETLSAQGLERLLQDAEKFYEATAEQLNGQEAKMKQLDGEIENQKKKVAEMQDAVATAERARGQQLQAVAQAQSALQKLQTTHGSGTAELQSLEREKSVASQKVLDLLGTIYVEKLPVSVAPAAENEGADPQDGESGKRKTSKTKTASAKQAAASQDLLVRIQNCISSPQQNVLAILHELQLDMTPHRPDHQQRFTELQELLKEKRVAGNRRTGNLQEEEETLKSMDAAAAAAKKKVQTAQTRLQTLLKMRSSALNELVDKLKDSLSEVYRLLSGYGLAFLQVNDPVQPFKDGGIELMVQPPGDQVRRAFDLSGGEQGLLRIALMLAMASTLQWKLIVFDEADQNLDSDKIERLRQALAQVKAQVVFVTHNPELAQSADFLVGVTQRENELSKVFYLKPSGSASE